MTEYRLVCDEIGRLACRPYNAAALNRLAAKLGISRLWWRGGAIGYCNIPHRRLKEISAHCEPVTREELDNEICTVNGSHVAKLRRLASE